MNYRRIWEDHNNRKIPKGYHIHHIDGDRTNNSPENLQCCSPDEHKLIHYIQGDLIVCRGRFIQACGAGKTYEERHGIKKAAELRKSRTESNIRRGPRTKQTKQRMSETRKKRYKNGNLTIVFSERWKQEQGDPSKINRKETCYKCGRAMNLGNLKKWHNDNCMEGLRKYANS